MSTARLLMFCAPLLAFGACKGDSNGKNDQATKGATIDATVAAVAPPPPAQTATHSGGMERFKEAGVYVDGKPLGVMQFGELPVSLKPVWFEERAAVPFKAGDPGPKFKISKQRRYRFREYLESMGVDVKRVKALHIYGGNQRAVAVSISGDKLRKNDDLLFRFGGGIWGKPLPACPPVIGDGLSLIQI